MSTEQDAVLIEGIRSLVPYLDRLVIVGGWATYLYNKMYSLRPERDPLLTRDIDVVIPENGFHEGVPSLDNTILAAGFRHEFMSLTKPPVVKYVKELPEALQIEIEFITDAPGEYEGVKEIGSVNAQSLHFVSLLLDNPWECDLEKVGFVSGMKVRIPNPSSYIFQKALIAPRRREYQKTAKDLYYIFYVLESFPQWKEATLKGIADYTSRRKKWMDRARAYLANGFTDLDSAGVKMVVGQRPNAAFPSMNDDQFGQYVVSMMQELVTAMKS